MSQRIRMAVLAASVVAIGASAPAAFSSTTASSADWCEENCYYNRYRPCIDAGFPRDFCLAQYNDCVDRCAI